MVCIPLVRVPVQGIAFGPTLKLRRQISSSSISSQYIKALNSRKRNSLSRHRKHINACSLNFSTSSSQSSSEEIPKDLAGSAPYYTRHLILHTAHPHTSWPSHFESTSPLAAELIRRWSKHPELRKLGYNFTDSALGTLDSSSSTEKAAVIQWDSTRKKSHTSPPTFPPEKGELEESYGGYLYPDFIPVPPLSISTLDEFEAFYLGLGPPKLSPESVNFPQNQIPHQKANEESGSRKSSNEVHIYICTHGTRDCRCADLGEPLYEALIREARRQHIGGTFASYGTSSFSTNTEELSSSPSTVVKISRIGHVGGHKWAGNALVYRQEDGVCDWYGLLRDTDALTLLDYATAQRPNQSSSSKLPPKTTPWYERWRGRLNLPAEDCQDILAKYTAASDLDKTHSVLSHVVSDSLKAIKKHKARGALGDPVELVFRSWDDQDEFRVQGYEGESVMATARRHDIDSILATCGGFCECATCHVHFRSLLATPSIEEKIILSNSSKLTFMKDSTVPQPASMPLGTESILPPVSDEEEDQLDFALGRDEDSRLSCQIPVTKEIGQWMQHGGYIRLPRY